MTLLTLFIAVDAAAAAAAAVLAVGVHSLSSQETGRQADDFRLAD